MNWKILFAIAKKDLLEVRQNRGAWMPMLIVPIIFLGVLPAAILLLPKFVPLPPDFFAQDSDLDIFFNNMPPAFSAAFSGLDDFQSMVLMMFGHIMAPMFLIFPLMFATVIAAESFAGELERRTMEALLYTPATDRELFLGKVLSGFLPAVLLTWGLFILYIIILNTAGFDLFGGLWFPLPSWYPLILWITPALALLGIAATVLISSRSRTFMGAYQTSSSLVLLVVILLAGQLSGTVYLTVPVGMLIGAVLWLVALGLTWLAVRGFNRQNLLSGNS